MQTIDALILFPKDMKNNTWQSDHIQFTRGCSLWLRQRINTWIVFLVFAATSCSWTSWPWRISMALACRRTLFSTWGITGLLWGAPARARLAGTDLTHLEFCERPVRSFVEVRQSEPMGFVGAKALDPAQHPVVVARLGGLWDVLGGPAWVPAAHCLVLSSTHCWVRLKEEEVSMICTNLLFNIQRS